MNSVFSQDRDYRALSKTGLQQEVGHLVRSGFDLSVGDAAIGCVDRDVACELFRGLADQVLNIRFAIRVLHESLRGKHLGLQSESWNLFSAGCRHCAADEKAVTVGHQTRGSR